MEYLIYLIIYKFVAKKSLHHGSFQILQRLAAKLVDRVATESFIVQQNIRMDMNFLCNNILTSPSLRLSCISKWVSIGLLHTDKPQLHENDPKMLRN
jgi:hypothetical protein